MAHKPIFFFTLQVIVQNIAGVEIWFSLMLMLFVVLLHKTHVHSCIVQLILSNVSFTSFNTFFTTLWNDYYWYQIWVTIKRSCLAHLNWELKWAFLIACHLYICKCFTFLSSPIEPMGQFKKIIWHKVFLGWRNFKFFTMKNHYDILCEKGIIATEWKCMITLKIFCRNKGNSTKFVKEYLHIKAIQLCSNERQSPFPRGENSDTGTMKMHWQPFS